MVPIAIVSAIVMTTCVMQKLDVKVAPVVILDTERRAIVKVR